MKPDCIIMGEINHGYIHGNRYKVLGVRIKKFFNLVQNSFLA